MGVELRGSAHALGLCRGGHHATPPQALARARHLREPETLETDRVPDSLGQDTLSRSGQPDAFTLAEGTFLTLPPSSLTVVIPPLIAVICVEINT